MLAFKKFDRQIFVVCTVVRNNRSSIFMRDKNVASKGSPFMGEVVEGTAFF